MRDAVIIELDNDKELVITIDGCTGVGFLKEDLVPLEAKEVSKSTCKVSLMEMLSLGAKPIACSYNYGGELSKYNSVLEGIEECFKEFCLGMVPFISSSEKNFPVQQTTIGISLTGIRQKSKSIQKACNQAVVIGHPLVGHEVLQNPDKLINPKEFMSLLKEDGVIEIVPLGSGGLESELKTRGLKGLSADYPISKSAGPACCVLVFCEEGKAEAIANKYNSKSSLIELMEE